MSLKFLRMTAFLLLSASTAPVIAPNFGVQAEVMTVEQIVELSSAGLGDDAIVAKIKSSGTKIDLNIDQMMMMKSKGVSGPVIAAVISGGVQKGEGPALSIDSPDPSVPHPPGVYLVKNADAAAKMVRIDSTMTNQARTSNILGYALTSGLASMSVKASIQNAHARVTSDEHAPTFYFFFDESNPSTATNSSAWASGTATTVTSPSEFTLIKLEVKKDRRDAKVGKMNIAGAKSGVMDKDRIPFNYELVRPGVYKITTQEPLGSGEYGFIYALGNSGTGGAMAARIFDFSVS